MATAAAIGAALWARESAVGRERASDYRETVEPRGKTPPSPSDSTDPIPVVPKLKTPKGIVLITLDAVRADHVSAYGYARNTTPHIDRLAAEAVLFEQARSQGPSTKYSLPSLLTGRYYSSIAMGRTGFWRELLPANVTVAERLKSLGFATNAILPYFRFRKASGYAQGFDVWLTSDDFSRKPIWEPVADVVTDKGLELVDQLVKDGSPWFLWLHYFDPHSAYVRHPETAQFGKTRIDRYDGEILFADHHIQRFMDGLRERGVYNETTVIVAGDHGEGLDRKRDHGILFHGFTLFDSEIHVPLIIKTPGADPRRIQTPVGLVDVPPTILELADSMVPTMDAPLDNIQGNSLVSFLKGGNPERGVVFSELPEKSQYAATIHWPHKLICEAKVDSCALYNLEADPEERTNLAERHPEIVREMRAKHPL